MSVKAGHSVFNQLLIAGTGRICPLCSKATMADVWWDSLWPRAHPGLLQSTKALHQLPALGNPGWLLHALQAVFNLPNIPFRLFVPRLQNIFTQPQIPEVQCNLREKGENANVIFSPFFGLVGSF